MSILDNPNVPEMDPAVRMAEGIKQRAKATYLQLVQAFNQGAQMFWKNPRIKPSEMAAALGTDAKEVFELHGKIGALLATIKPEAIAEGVAAVGQFSYNEDGSVTVVDPTTTTPAPTIRSVPN